MDAVWLENSYTSTQFFSALINQVLPVRKIRPPLIVPVLRHHLVPHIERLCDLLNMPAVEQLEKDAKHALAYQLMKFFLTKRLDAYLEFQAANPDLLKSYGLVHEDCITKMRLISLMDLGSDESGRIPYGAIRDTLHVRLMLTKLNFGW